VVDFTHHRLNETYGISSAFTGKRRILAGFKRPSAVLGKFLWEIYLVLFLFLYFSDIMPFPPRPLFVYASIPLAVLGVTHYRKATSSPQYFLKALMVSWVYQALMTQEIFIKPLFGTLAVFYVVTYYQRYGYDGLSTMKIVVIGLFLTSFIFFLATVISDTAVDWRGRLYAGVDWKQLSDLMDKYNKQGGLTSALFYFSYQVSAGITLFYSEMITSGFRKSVCLYAILLCIGILTLLLSGERSPLLAVMISVIVIGWMIRQIRRTIVILICLAVLYFPVILLSERFTAQRENTNLIARLTNEGHHSEALGRIETQLWALCQIPFYPLGTHGAGESYFELIEDSDVEYAIAPHNGYITRVVFYGWVLMGVVVAVFMRIYNMARQIVHQNLYKVLPVFAALFAILVNACFHNQSFLSFAPETILLMMLFASFFDFYRSENLENPKPGVRSKAIGV
jgi:hypothetical protein